jgi:hypothetical protein
MTATSIRPVLVAIFEEDRRARAALHTLHEIGFTRYQLGYVARHGEALETAGTLAEVDAPEHDLAGGLICLGVPFHAALDIAGMLDHGHTIVAVQCGQLWLAERELRLAGALIVRRWETSAAA